MDFLQCTTTKGLFSEKINVELLFRSCGHLYVSVRFVKHKS